MKLPRLLDHLVRPEQQRRRDGQPEGLRRLQVDDELELGGLLDREVARLGALQDLIDLGGGPPEVLPSVGPVRHEATGLRVLLHRIHRRQAALCRQLHDPCSVGEEHISPEGDECASPVFGHCREGTGEIAGSPRFQHLKLHLQRSGRDLCLSQIERVGWNGRIREHGHAGDSGDGLLEQLQPLADQLRREGGQSRDVSPRSPPACASPPTRGAGRRGPRSDVAHGQDLPEARSARPPRAVGSRGRHSPGRCQGGASPPRTTRTDRGRSDPRRARARVGALPCPLRAPCRRPPFGVGGPIVHDSPPSCVPPSPPYHGVSGLP
jgi:hypothetical protein